MTDDHQLSRALTAALRQVPGVRDVYAARASVGVAVAAVDAVSAMVPRLELEAPDVLVDIERAEGFTTISAHISTTASWPAPEVLRAAGERLRSLAVESDLPAGDELAVNVRLRLVEGVGDDDD